MSFLIHTLVAMIMPIALKVGRFTRIPVHSRYMTDFYERGDYRLVKVPFLDHAHYVHVAKFRFGGDGSLRVTCRHDGHEFWNVPPTDTLPGVESYEPLFWRWAASGDRALGKMILMWHDAIRRYDELLLQRQLLVGSLERLIDAIEPLRGSGPISLPRIHAYICGLHDGCLRGGLADHADLFAAVEAPLNLGGRKPPPPSQPNRPLMGC